MKHIPEKEKRAWEMGSFLCILLSLGIVGAGFFASGAVGELFPGRAGQVETLSLKAPENIFLTGEDGELVFHPWNTFEKEKCVPYSKGIGYSPRQIFAAKEVLDCLENTPPELSWRIASGLEEAVYLSMEDESVYIPETPVTLGDGRTRLFSMAFSPEGIFYVHEKSRDTPSGDSNQVELALSLLEEARVKMGVGQMEKTGPSRVEEEGDAVSSPIVSPQPNLSSPAFSENPYLRFLGILEWIYEKEYETTNDMIFPATASLAEVVASGECSTLYREGETLVSLALPGQEALILFFGRDDSGDPAITGFSMKD